MYKVLLLLLVALAHCHYANSHNIINRIFGKPHIAIEKADRSTDFVTQNLTTTSRGHTWAPRNLSCTMADGQPGECVYYFLCNSNKSVITDGAKLIDIRTAGLLISDLREESHRQSLVRHSADASARSIPDQQCESYVETCCLVPDIRPPTDPVKPEAKGCGWANPKGAGSGITFETNGVTKFGEFPWMVAVLKLVPVDDNNPEDDTHNVYLGGGSLIHPSAVLTAAHHVSELKNYKVRAGEWDIQSTKEIYPYQDRRVSSIERHKDFNKDNLFYNIAILFLNTPMDLAPNVGVACLPPPRERVTSGIRCFATGWGKDKFEKEGRYQVILKKVEVPVVEHSACQTALRGTRLGRHFELHSSFMCAGGEKGIDVCKGDGGSPLSCPISDEEGRYMQSGIVAWGMGCGADGVPGVYVDVANLRNWIDNKISDKGYSPKIYSYTF